MGHQVELECSAYTWDGASTETTEFSSGSLSFIVGEEQVTSGLDLAVQQLKKGDQVGQGSYIICNKYTHKFTYLRNILSGNSFVLFIMCIYVWLGHAYVFYLWMY